MKNSPFDSLLLLTYGGPECAEDVEPFLNHILAGKSVSPERRAETMRHYALFGGVSPINAHSRQLLEAMRETLVHRKIDLPVYWACRHTQPFLSDVFCRMMEDGARRTLVFVPAPFGGIASDGAYQSALNVAAAEAGPLAPCWTKIPPFYDRPEFIAAQADILVQALNSLCAREKTQAVLLFTAHSVPLSHGDTAEYARQVTSCTSRIGKELAGMVEDAPEHAYLAWQSASGPSRTWLSPGVNETLKSIAADHPQATVLVLPLGFPLENMEIAYDLDTEAAAFAYSLGLTFRRLPTLGTRCVEMLYDSLVQIDSSSRSART